MFTGIVDHCGKILAVEKTEAGLQLTISSRFTDLTLGESVCVDGACLTVTSFTPEGTFTCDLSPETLQKTVAGTYRKNHEVNLERALRLSDRLGGHFVQGHVDQQAEIIGKRVIDEYVCLNISGIDSKYSALLVTKGSVTVNGVSLTVNSVFRNGFEVMIIPHTRERTNIGFLAPSDKVNVEFDWMAKLVVNNMSHYTQRETT